MLSFTKLIQNCFCDDGWVYDQSFAVCPKAVEFSLARGIVTFHGSTCFKCSVSKKERNWRRRDRSWRDPAQNSLVFHPFTVTELFYQLNAWNWPFTDRMRVRRAQPLPSHLFLFLPYSGFPDKLLAPIHTGWREALEVSCPLSIVHCPSSPLTVSYPSILGSCVVWTATVQLCSWYGYLWLP